MNADVNEESAGVPKTTSGQSHRARRWLIRGAIAIVVLLIAVELFARFYLGLGDPPLMVADSKIEYLYQPNQTCHRFGNLIHYNAYSMRSDDFPAHKSSPDEFRVMVVGDSVINGGSLTDQSQIATTLLQKELPAMLHKRVIVGNISAGSWGPPNELAYLQRFGLFDADVLVIVVSSHDYIDVPTFEPSVGVMLDMPDHRPWTATGELLHRYVIPRLLQHVARLGDLPPPTEDQVSPDAVRQCSDAVKAMIELARARGARPIVAQHLEAKEIDGPLMPGHDILRDAAASEQVTIVQLGPAFRDAFHRGEVPYRDSIHPNPLGQRLIANDLEKVIVTP